MKKKFIWRISVVTSAEADEAVTEMLSDVSGQQMSSFLDAETKRVTVSAYFPRKPSQWNQWRASLRGGIINIRRSGLDPSPAKISLSRIPRERWADSWKRHFKPLEIGPALLIKPSWIRRKPRKGQSVVVLDPGLSFGTGQHPTTEFCLRQIVKKSFTFRASGFESRRARVMDDSKLRTRNQKLSFLDIGCGSGILAISAAKLGYSPVDAFDFDAEAIRVVRVNAQRNGVSRKIHISRQDLTRLSLRVAKKYDVICANLISTLLISEQKRIISRLKSDGTLVLAGILKKEFSQLKRAYEARGLRLIASKTGKEWRSGAFICNPTS